MKSRVASFSMRRLTLLFRCTAPVSQVPLGTRTTPPPAALQAVMAARIASVQSVTPSPLAPCAVISTVRFGKVGALMRARIASASFQGSADWANVGAAWAKAPAATEACKARRRVSMRGFPGEACFSLQTSGARGAHKRLNGHGR